VRRDVAALAHVFRKRGGDEGVQIKTRQFERHRHVRFVCAIQRSIFDSSTGSGSAPDISTCS
jgi:hypothetical protein